MYYTSDQLYKKILKSKRKSLHISEFCNKSEIVKYEKLEIQLVNLFEIHPEIGSFDQSNGWITVSPTIYSHNLKEGKLLNFIVIMIISALSFITAFLLLFEMDDFFPFDNVTSIAVLLLLGLGCGILLFQIHQFIKPVIDNTPGI